MSKIETTINGVCEERLTSNEVYGAYSERFDIRAGQLVRLGFIRKTLEEYNIGIFVKKVIGLKYPEVIQPAFIMNASNRVWNERIEQLKTMLHIEE